MNKSQYKKKLGVVPSFYISESFYWASANMLASPTNSEILSSAWRRAIVLLMASTKSGLFFLTATEEPPASSVKLYSATAKSGFAFT